MADFKADMKILKDGNKNISAADCYGGQKYPAKKKKMAEPPTPEIGQDSDGVHSSVMTHSVSDWSAVSTRNCLRLLVHTRVTAC